MILKTMKATGKRTAETRSTCVTRTYELIKIYFFNKSLTNCALSRTGLAAFKIGAGCDKMTCGVWEGAVVFDIDAYWTCELVVFGFIFLSEMLVLWTSVSICSPLLWCASSFL